MNFPLRKLQRSVACLWKFLSHRLIKLQKEFSTNTQLIAVIQIQYNYNTKGFLDKQRIDCYSRAHYWLERAAKVEIIWTQKVFVQPSCEICSSAAFVFDLLRIPIFSWICNQTAVTHAIHLIQNLKLTVKLFQTCHHIRWYIIITILLHIAIDTQPSRHLNIQSRCIQAYCLSHYRCTTVDSLQKFSYNVREQFYIIIILVS